MVSGFAVGVAGEAKHPVTRGALCPLAFGAHQLNWHPQRLRSVRHKESASSWSEARAAFAKACGEGRVVVIDGYPGRAASQALATFAQNQRGEYRVVRAPETRVLSPYEKWTGVSAEALGYDFENARTIVSFGASLLDGWGSPGAFTKLWAERAAGMADPQLRLIQVDKRMSRTASRAWKWIPLDSSANAALAAGLGRVMLEEKLVKATGPMPTMLLSEVAERTGMDMDAIRDLARNIVEKIPAVAVSNDASAAVAALNVVLGAVGATGGIVRNSEAKFSFISAEEEIRDARVVLIDASVPWDFTPATDAEVFRFAAWKGVSSHADWLLPAPGFSEEESDIPTPPALAKPTYGLAPALLRAEHETGSAWQFAAGVDSKVPAPAAIIHQRCEELFRTRRGKVHSQTVMAVSDFASAQKMEEAMWSGAVWVNEEPRHREFHCHLKTWPEQIDSTTSSSWLNAWHAPVLPPLAVKLYGESNLREVPERGRL